MTILQIVRLTTHLSFLYLYDESEKGRTERREKNEFLFFLLSHEFEFLDRERNMSQ